MMSKKQLSTRVDELEKLLGAGEPTSIILYWSDGDSITVDGEILSRDEALKRYPDMLFLEWRDGECTDE